MAGNKTLIGVAPMVLSPPLMVSCGDFSAKQDPVSGQDQLSETASMVL